jgi:hypothetical protein
VSKQVESLVESSFPDVKEEVLANPIMMGDFLNSTPDDQEAIDSKVYQDCGDFDAVSAKFNKFLIMYNEDERCT